MRRALAIVLAVIVAGCSPIEQAVSTPEIAPELVATAPLSPSELPQPYPPQPEPPQPEPGALLPPAVEPEVLDKPLSGSFDTAVHSFWFRRNTVNQQPYIGLKPEFMQNYGCIALGRNTEKYVYLTFDEGYEQGYTPHILNVLKEQEVSAAFFVTGHYVRMHPQLVKRMAEEGHVIGNHTVSHPGLAELSAESIREELQGLDKLLVELIGEGTYFMRPPMGQYSEFSLAHTQHLGYRTVFWSLAYADWYIDKQPGADYALDIVVANIHPGAVILLHAVSQSNALALERIIVELKRQGYEFRSLDDFR